MKIPYAIEIFKNISGKQDLLFCESKAELQFNLNTTKFSPCKIIAIIKKIRLK